MMDWSRLLICRRAGPSDHLDGDRTEFEQDLSRVVFSTPVRRLQDKTHVFPLEQHDAVRTRLTHSLEVSSVARDLSQAAVPAAGRPHSAAVCSRHFHHRGGLRAAARRGQSALRPRGRKSHPGLVRRGSWREDRALRRHAGREA